MHRSFGWRVFSRLHDREPRTFLLAIRHGVRGMYRKRCIGDGVRIAKTIRADGTLSCKDAQQLTRHPTETTSPLRRRRVSNILDGTPNPVGALLRRRPLCCRRGNCQGPEGQGQDTFLSSTDICRPVLGRRKRIVPAAQKTSAFLFRYVP